MKTSPIFKSFLSILLCTLSTLTFAANTNYNASLSIPKDAQLLFIQVAKSGEIKTIPNQPNSYEITLKQVDPYTSYFTESPNRITGLMPTKQFFKIWQTQTAKAGTEQPNVAIETSDAKTGQRINQIFALTNPVINPKTNSIKYQAKLLANHSNTNAVPTDTKLGYTVLFIDDFHWHGNIFGN